MSYKLVQITDDLTMVNEGNVGGFLIQKDPATFMPNLWTRICQKYNISSVIDVGCGMGYALIEFKKYAGYVFGIDGSEFVQQHSPVKHLIQKVDFSKELMTCSTPFDLCWSCEFVEHVEEQYIPNYIDIFKKSKYVAITYADIGQDGYHHVNCQNKEYWINLFTKHGLEYSEEDTQEFRKYAYEDGLVYNSAYKDNHFYNRGLFFINKTIKAN